MYSGMRIEEICSLTTADIITRDSVKCMSIQVSKTKKGIRLVPIHKKLQPLIKKAKDQSEDGYVVSGLTLNKYGDRSNAIGKRFGRLKTSLGFTDKYVFHSIRKCVVTQLENKGIPEGAVADLVGHEKPNMTFGTYSGGFNLQEIKKIVDKISYP